VAINFVLLYVAWLRWTYSGTKRQNSDMGL